MIMILFVLLGIAVVHMIYMYAFWLPHVESTLRDLNVRLPYMTVIVFKLGYFVQEYWFIIVPAIIVTTIGLYLTVKGFQTAVKFGVVVVVLCAVMLASLLCYFAATIPIREMQSNIS